jgi:proteic killer suppression protein
VIIRYRDKRSRLFAEGGFVREFEEFRQQADKRLTIWRRQPDWTTCEACRRTVWNPCKATEAGIRVNLQWRICFEWRPGASGPSTLKSRTIIRLGRRLL